jgi:hypothetical protein
MKEIRMSGGMIMYRVLIVIGVSLWSTRAERTFDIALARAADVRETPVIYMWGKWLNELAAAAFHTWLDELAVKYGLPAPGRIDGEINHYGMTSEGEFTRSESEAQ